MSNSERLLLYTLNVLLAALLVTLFVTGVINGWWLSCAIWAFAFALALWGATVQARRLT